MSHPRRARGEFRAVKRGEAYLVEGTAEGRRVSFWATAETVEGMRPAEAEAFLRRSVQNLARRETEAEKGG